MTAPTPEDISTTHSASDQATDMICTRMFSSSEEAVAKSRERLQDMRLKQAVAEFLAGDVPDYFQRDTPFFYLARFLATPNYETEKVSRLAQQYDVPLIIGTDVRSTFVTQNELKLPLGKLPVTEGVGKNGEPIIRYVSIIDVAKAQGKPLDTITTNTGQGLIEYHQELFAYAKIPNTIVCDETAWITRASRDDIYEQYKKTMALLCAHGIWLESFLPDEYEFLKSVVFPAFIAVEDALGVAPLIVEHISPEEEATRNWNAYPQRLSEYIHSTV